ncbi:MAG: histidine--tRNA ligase, partial [Candidatus Schekmanbacteria bacterium]|nr:histidine--tRNA ligase [Candidatus Schekmanbacteria bacterium]
MSSQKIAPLSGFPEWTPEGRLVEQRIIDRLREKFEGYGFVPIETRSVEPLEHLLKQGETDKEIYLLSRLQAAEGEGELGLGLHYDLTVPFARYVKQHFSQLTFPLKRYQIQKVWRGERPQEGRYREFYQADIDVIDQDALSLEFDAEMPAIIAELWAELPIPPLRIRINNRKIMEGFYRAQGVEDVHAVLRIVDKMHKIGAAAVKQALIVDLRLSDSTAARCLALAEIHAEDCGFAAAVERLGARHPLLEEGIAELVAVMAALRELPRGTVMADMRIARGLDYYTGTVYESELIGHESLGAVASGGRYDNLASIGTRIRLPGVGISIGLTRMLAKLLPAGVIRPSRATPTCVLVALPSAEHRLVARAVARALRSRGLPCEVFHEPVK